MSFLVRKGIIFLYDRYFHNFITAAFIKKRQNYKKSVTLIIREIKRVLLQEIFQLDTL